MAKERRTSYSRIVTQDAIECWAVIRLATESAVACARSSHRWRALDPRLRSSIATRWTRQYHFDGDGCPHVAVPPASRSEPPRMAKRPEKTGPHPKRASVRPRWDGNPSEANAEAPVNGQQDAGDESCCRGTEIDSRGSDISRFTKAM